jgi:hypothetical protein
MFSCQTLALPTQGRQGPKARLAVWQAPCNRAAVTVNFQALQILGQWHLKPQDCELEICPLQQRESDKDLLRFDQRLHEIIESLLVAFTQNEAVIAGKLTRVVA